mmetsp:Transcript_47214/g.78337  ORF Transcript_47214/g.78337 Transcript_47214/m.78337 type:complete len:181 (+) Transcript_47214:45-587(+)|eukprot:CAMPEP_0202713500 /NCGR_PEP_ID=MMETSP1385-20130828/55207_1 /ASSEMBLY_ACC=CAM_ASM_000861 /TAXON_ID=933848 /ORGANISM="Elphidium margaritaceum" /LENGTH=180 /DNA_ID=CAMNT_0049373873 /DNA_START=38 /DNA_END=580 /DNA_ORIENTATION=+
MGQDDVLRVKLYRYVEKQTSLANLILYIYLFWYLFLIVVIGAKHLHYMHWFNGVFVAVFVFFALNAAAYQPPMCGESGYTKHPFKIARFFLIPFCVSTASVACGMAHDECMLLFPTDPLLMWTQIGCMVVLFGIGMTGHHFASQKLAAIDRVQQGDPKFVMKDITPNSVPDDDGDDENLT